MGEIRITATARPGHAGVRLPDKRILLEGQTALVDESILARPFPGRDYIAQVPAEPEIEPEAAGEDEPEPEKKAARRRRKAIED